MTVKFEYCEKSNICVVRANNYSRSLAHLMAMFNSTMSDFPALATRDVTVKQYGGDRHKRQFGIEFTPTNDVPEKYERIHQLEVVL